MNTVFSPVNPVLHRNMYIFKVTVFINRAKYKKNTVFFPSFRVFNVQAVIPLSVVAGAAVPAAVCRWRLCPHYPGGGWGLSGVIILDSREGEGYSSRCLYIDL